MKDKHFVRKQQVRMAGFPFMSGTAKAGGICASSNNARQQLSTLYNSYQFTIFPMITTA